MVLHHRKIMIKNQTNKADAVFFLKSSTPYLMLTQHKLLTEDCSVCCNCVKYTKDSNGTGLYWDQSKSVTVVRLGICRALTE